MTMFLQFLLAFTVARLSERFVLWVGKLLWQRVALWAWAVISTVKN